MYDVLIYKYIVITIIKVINIPLNIVNHLFCVWWEPKICYFIRFQVYSSVQFSYSVMSDSLRPHELQHARPPCPSPTPRVHSNSYPLSRWCHPAISSSVLPFSSCPQSLPASESLPMSQLFTWGGQSIWVSALASVLPKNTQDWSPLEWTGWISFNIIYHNFQYIIWTWKFFEIVFDNVIHFLFLLPIMKTVYLKIFVHLIQIFELVGVHLFIVFYC